MNTKDYIHLLNRPYSLNEKQTGELERILSEFPFLLSARAIYLKGLYNQDSFRYNTELKKTAAYTTDRSVLFDFITSEQFQSVQKKLYDEQQAAVAQISVTDTEIVAVPVADKLEESIKKLVAEAEPETAIELEHVAGPLPEMTVVKDEEPAFVEAPQEQHEPAEEVAEAETHLSIGKPLEFNDGERHSFAEWLQLSKLTPIQREEVPSTPEATEPEEENPLAKKLDLIDRFIENNPKIAPAKSIPAPANIDRSVEDNSSLMTETLARVYLEQKKYAKAIQAYEILILKYPEKSVFFADRISDIKTLQQNNN